MIDTIDCFQDIEKPGIIRPFLQKGDWAIHEVLPFLLSRLGPCKVKIATFSVSEESLRPLFLLQEDKQITDLRLLLDYTVKRHKLDLLLFATSITPDIRTDSCHAKILLLENEKYKFGIVGSANLNTNHRWEAGVTFTAGELYTYFDEAFEKAYKDALPYEVLE